MTVRRFLPVLFCWVAVATPLFAAQSQYDAWRGQSVTWIRVGIKDPDTVQTLRSDSPLLVLEGDRVVQTIKPGGLFRVTSARIQRKGYRYWVHIHAAPKRQDVEVLQTKLEGLHPESAFKVVKQKDGYALRGGPYVKKQDAAAARDALVGEGYAKAEVVTSKTRYPLQWVNRFYDKFDLRAEKEVGLVHADPNQPIRYAGTAYRGVLRFRVSGGKIRIINELPMEVYLRGVVPTELGPNVFPELEALKAQAVAARTYALKNMGRFNRRGYDICDTPACQAYEGTLNEHPLSDQAVAETEGVVMYHGDTLIDALYTSTCGGLTDDVGNVFPGRNEPYLKSKSSYVAAYPSWTLPKKDPPKAVAALGGHLAAEALLYRLQPIDSDAALGAKQFQKYLEQLRWIYGDVPTYRGPEHVTVRAFWETLAQLPAVVSVMKHQFHPADSVRPLLGRDLDPGLQPLAAFLLRFEFVNNDEVARLDSEAPLLHNQAVALLLQLAHAWGPEPEWDRYTVTDVKNGVLYLQRGTRSKTLALANVRYYLSEHAEEWRFQSQPKLEKLDRVYLIDGPFPQNILRIQENYKVASVDRFSAYDVWVDKKSVEALEKRARRYVRGLRGIRDVKVLSRSAAGRVTELEFVADSGNRRVKGLNIRWSLGVRDNLIDLVPSYRNGRLVHLTVMGRGWGHGVGMSQVGAYGMAAQGWRFDQILTHYYDGVEVAAYVGKTKPDSGSP
ncbi:SpoIID/LytB domain-containing protein [Acanthopleuribacter pedis]|uniref:SpoIID/LytB domain-containing protein n=1 Tax=Acanthopleuribacter pedis TaxID=442870 RepID=A0A8J7QD99_9BACT|nr:SpoIID/LytB domain-containing protein [Acanthopleuribacter pedis]MBO1321664.1 SpoIID/LytB domain-containing protein [Acanthopleuribacter pedis]